MVRLSSGCFFQNRILIFMILFSLLIFIIIINLILYFQAAHHLSIAEKWLTDYADLSDWQKNFALTKKLMSAILGHQMVTEPSLILLQKLRMKFYGCILLLFIAALFVWTW